ncbi:MAG: glutamate 5-kinase, partial [bacterium]|nr:glutamate 5-kinase [bacterium]
MTIVVKIGTKALTKDGHLNAKAIERLAEQLAALRAKRHQVILVSSGAMGAGRSVLGKTQTKRESLKERQLFAAIGQPLLMSTYREAFKKFDIVPAQFLVTYHDFRDRLHYTHLRTVVETALHQHILPIFNENDAIATDELKFGDNDRLSVLIAGLVNADALVLLTDTVGLWSLDPITGACTKLISVLANDDLSWKKLCSPTASGQGGMLSKVATAQLAARLGIAAYIGKADTCDLTTIGQKWQGTRVEPVRKAASIQRWLATNPMSDGAIVIDDGAAIALKRHKSLLAVGVKRVTGTFRIGDLIDVATLDGKVVAKGIVGYSARSLATLLRSRKTKGAKEVIHCDKLV